MKTYTEEEQIEYGEKIAAMFFMEKTEDGYYKTKWGLKSAMGLFQTFFSVYEGIKDRIF